MAKEFSRAFYNSRTWKECKEEYLRSKGYLCERCLKQGKITPAKIVHHKIHLNPNNINNPEVAIGFNNLEAINIIGNTFFNNLNSSIPKFL